MNSCRQHHAELILNIAANCRKTLQYIHVHVFKRDKKGLQILNSEDFNPIFFTLGWDTVFDHLGDACRIHFPVEMKSAIRWFKKLFNREEDGTLKLIL